MTALGFRPLPDVEDPEFAAYWQSARAHRLVIQRCDMCETPRWPPREVCLACRSLEWSWFPVEPAGHLYSWTVVERAGTPGLATPYIVAVVELVDPPGVRVLGNIIDDATGVAAHLEIGTPVEGVFESLGEGVVLLQWRVATDASHPA